MKFKNPMLVVTDIDKSVQTVDNRPLFGGGCLFSV